MMGGAAAFPLTFSRVRATQWLPLHCRAAAHRAVAQARARQPPYSVRPIPSHFPAHVAGGKGVIISGRWFAPTHTIMERQPYKPPPPCMYVMCMNVRPFSFLYAHVRARFKIYECVYGRLISASFLPPTLWSLFWPNNTHNAHTALMLVVVPTSAYITIHASVRA